MNMLDPKYQQKSKSMTSPEQNYFAHFAMIYPVEQIFLTVGQNNYGNKIPFLTYNLIAVLKYIFFLLCTESRGGRIFGASMPGRFQPNLLLEPKIIGFQNRVWLSGGPLYSLLDSLYKKHFNLITVLNFLFQKVEEEESLGPQCLVDFSPIYSITSSIVSFFLPCIIMLTIYFHLYAIARRHLNEMR